MKRLLPIAAVSVILTVIIRLLYRDNYRHVIRDAICALISIIIAIIITLSQAKSNGSFTKSASYKPAHFNKEGYLVPYQTE